MAYFGKKKKKEKKIFKCDREVRIEEYLSVYDFSANVVKHQFVSKNYLSRI